MALEVALAVLGPAIDVVKLVGRPILRQFNYLCCFTSNINSLKEEFRNLNDDIEELEEEVRIARDNVQKPVPRVKTWLTNSNNLKVEINGILNEATTVESGCSKLGARFSLSKRAKKTTDRTKELRGEKNFEVKFQQGSPAARQAGQLGKTYEFELRNKIEEKIMTTLRGGDVNMIGIHGMGGLGKTTMAKKLMNRVLKEHVFEEVVFATVSQNVDISKFQDEVAGQLGLEKLKDEKLESARVKILHSRLSDTKRTLLVLDDVWEKLELESIGIPRDSKWCTIILTSRNRDALRDMGAQISGMELLSEEEAWSFFRERAGACVDDRELNPIAKLVAKECGRLPINLAAVGAGLKDEDDVFIWEDALRQLSHSDQDIPELISEVYNSLKLSYDRLRSEQAKSMFLLFCLFREDADIPLEYLTYFCMGLGIFRGIGNLKEARNKTVALTKMLKSRSLLLDSDEEDCVRMHDAVRDVCIFIAKQIGCIGGTSCTWISSSHLVGERNELLSGSRYPKLRLLFLDSRYDGDDDSLGFKFNDAFLEGMRELHVLCIQNYYSSTILPRPTQSLGKLNTLILESCKELKTISVVGELVNLEILICCYCYGIEKLPSEMKGLYRLKVLELTGCRNLQSIERGIISSLVRLEELKMCGSFDRWEAEDREERENASIKELEALPNLACLEIEIQDPSLVSENMPLFSSKKIVRFIIRTDSEYESKFSKAMSLRLERETRLGDWIEMQLLRDTEYLYLKGDGANNVNLAQSQNIRWLELRKCESMKNVVSTSGGSDDATVFPSIEHLELYYLPELEEICDGPISSTSFQNLKELELRDLSALTQIWKSSSVSQNNYVPHFTNLSSIEIYWCDSLRNLGQLSMAGKDCLPQLQQLSIKECEMMEQVFLWNDMEEAAESQRKCHVITKVFPKLKEVELFSLPNLTTFYQGIQSIEFPLLQNMKIKKCPNWKNIIIGSSSVDIDDDDSLHLLCQPQKISFGSLEVLEINHNPFCRHEILSSLFNGLKELRINKYEGSTSLFMLSMAANLVSLRILCISKCEEMTKVIEDEQQQQRILLFPNLEILQLQNLPKLVSLCDSKCEVEFPILTYVEIRKCPNMKNFSLGLIATPNLEAFRTDLTTYVGVGVDVAFNSLKKLEIYRNENPLYDDKISVFLFNALEKLEFSHCKGSMSLFSCSAVGNLVNLRELVLLCDEMVKVIEDEDEKVVSVVFPKLEELTLLSLPKLVRFCEWKCDVELPSLTTLRIWNCPNIESFSMGFVAAPNLKFVEIDDHTDIDLRKDLNGALQQHYLARQEKKDFCLNCHLCNQENEEEESSQEKDEIEADDQN